MGLCLGRQYRNKSGVKIELTEPSTASMEPSFVHRASLAFRRASNAIVARLTVPEHNRCKDDATRLVESLKSLAMVISTIFGVVRGAVDPRLDSDGVDRLSYLYTSALLSAASVLVSFKLFGGKPLECWAPAHFTDVWQDYTEMFCWAKNTYYVPFQDIVWHAPIPQPLSKYDIQVPVGEEDRRRGQVAYYQWVPFFLIGQAALFYAPMLVWHWLLTNSSIRVSEIVEKATAKDNIYPEHRSRTIAQLADQIVAILSHQQSVLRRYNKEPPSFSTRVRLFSHHNRFLSICYLFTKALYTVNALVHLCLMNAFLQTDAYDFYGFGAVADLLRGHAWEDSANFPRVTLCDFNVRVLGAVQQYTVQCVLAINIINEKLFILLWFLFSFLVAASIVSAFVWARALFHSGGLVGDVRLVLRFVELFAGRLLADELNAAVSARLVGQASTHSNITLEESQYAVVISSDTPTHAMT